MPKNCFEFPIIRISGPCSTSLFSVFLLALQACMPTQQAKQKQADEGRGIVSPTCKQTGLLPTGTSLFQELALLVTLEMQSQNRN